jgi:uncharacterized membrane protein
MSMRADHRSHLDLQINLLSAQEVTKVLQVLHRISQHLGIEDVIDAETEELAKKLKWTICSGTLRPLCRRTIHINPAAASTLTSIAAAIDRKIGQPARGTAR